MKAITYREYGSADVLRWGEIEAPRPTTRQVLIKVKACSVNPIDWRLRQGEGRYILPFGFPRVPGYDVAGIVLQAPINSGFMVGDHVTAFLDKPTGGAYAELAACSTNVVARIPASMSMQQAAAIGLAGTTALQCLRDFGHIGVGQHVVVTGASGGVGIFAVQIAKARGATVTGIASRDNEELVRSLGADHFVDYRQENYLRQVEPCDIFLDAAGKADVAKARLVLRDDGRFVTTEPSLKYLGMTVLSRLGLSSPFSTMLARPCARDLRELIHLWETNRLKIVINQEFPLDQAADAHRRGEDGLGVGKIILNVPEAI